MQTAHMNIPPQQQLARQCRLAAAPYLWFGCCWLLLGLTPAVVHAGQPANPIIIRGHKMYDAITKERFYCKGIDYEPDLYKNQFHGGTAVNSGRGYDHIKDEDEQHWRKDLPLLQELNVNCLRIYNINPIFSHEKFMRATSELGMYVLVSLSMALSPGILNNGLIAPACFPATFVANAKTIASHFARYDNLLAFVVGNEVANTANILNVGSMRGYPAMPCVRALQKSIKQHLRKCYCSLRQVPLIYAATDFDKPARKIIADYLMCDGGMDMYGLNVYSWCSRRATFWSESSYYSITKEFSKSQAPLMLTEYGCVGGSYQTTYPFTEGQRPWNQVEALLSEEMSKVFSGGFAYEYSMRGNNYGTVLLPGYEANQPEIKKLPNFFSLSEKYKAVNGPEEVAEWTHDTFCSWVPADYALKEDVACPSRQTVQDLWDVEEGSFGIEENWHETLPSDMPELNVDMPCNGARLSPASAREAGCAVGHCVCHDIPTHSHCRVAWVNLNSNSTQVRNFFERMCDKFANSNSRKHRHICDELKEGGRFHPCPIEARADYLLHVWASEVSGETECCTLLEEAAHCNYVPALAFISAPESNQYIGSKPAPSFVIKAPVSGGHPPLRLQWYRGSMPLTDNEWYSGSETSNLTIHTSDVDEADVPTIFGEEYRLEVLDAWMIKVETGAIHLHNGDPPPGIGPTLLFVALISSAFGVCFFFGHRHYKEVGPDQCMEDMGSFGTEVLRKTKQIIRLLIMQVRALMGNHDVSDMQPVPSTNADDDDDDDDDVEDSSVW